MEFALTVAFERKQVSRILKSARELEKSRKREKKEELGCEKITVSALIYKFKKNEETGIRKSTSSTKHVKSE